jgi:glycolate oxidase FAD binding subunit
MATLSRLAEQVRAATQTKSPLVLRGGGTKDFLGRRPEGDLLDLRVHAGIVAYEPTELVITARCGTPLEHLQAELAAHGQWLAFEPPAFGPAATVGGMVAAGLAGPGRVAFGAVRDFVLGVRMMNAQGEVLEFGGQVMKNVAGFDLSRLQAGALGILGPMLDVSLKVLPQPQARVTVQFALGEAEALAAVNAWSARALPISASAWHAGCLSLRLAGAARAVESSVAVLGGERLEPAAADALWRALREQQHGFFEGDAPLWRLSVPSTAPVIDLRGDTLFEWGGAQRWWRTAPEDDASERVRAAVSLVGGHATLFRGGDRTGGRFQPLTPAIAALHQRLKDTLDPARIFNRGRMYAEF